jgi:hypothetical protein
MERYEEKPTAAEEPSANYQLGYSDQREGNYADPPEDVRGSREYSAGWKRAVAEQLPALRAANEAVDQLRSELGDVCQPAAEALAVAWWHLEHAIRELTGKCSMGHALPIETNMVSGTVTLTDGGQECGCCNEFKKSKPRGK